MLVSINGRVRIPLPTAQGDVRELLPGPSLPELTVANGYKLIHQWGSLGVT